MEKSYNVRITSMLLYAVVLFLSNYLAYFIAVMIVTVLQPLVGVLPIVLLNILAFAIYIFMGLSVPILVIFFLFKYAVGRQYVPSEDKYSWVKSCIRLVLPAEIIRFLACQITLGQINEAGAFAFLPSLLFESTYLHWTGRGEVVRQKLLQYNFADFIAYALCFVVYLAIHLALVMKIYRRFWREAEKDRDDLIIYE